MIVMSGKRLLGCNGIHPFAFSLKVSAAGSLTGQPDPQGRGASSLGQCSRLGLLVGPVGPDGLDQCSGNAIL